MGRVPEALEELVETVVVAACAAGVNGAKRPPTKVNASAKDV